jgi:membrane dipeptidase
MNEFRKIASDPRRKKVMQIVAHVIKVVGADHVDIGIGLDLSGGRSCLFKDASGYPELVAAIQRITTPENLRKISGENWLRLRVIGAGMS